MAQTLVIRNHCDVCLSEGRETPGVTYSVAVSVVAPDERTEAPPTPMQYPGPFLAELCSEHAAALAEAVLAVAPFGRTSDGRRRQRADQTRPASGRVACPQCGHTSATLAGLRPHVRAEHGTSLAGVGLEPANVKCSECGDPFPNKQGLAAHFRSTHPDAKQSA